MSYKVEPDYKYIPEHDWAKVEGDLVVIEGVGAYCSSMSAKNYNSFLSPNEVLLEKDGKTSLIKKKQSLEQVMENEI